MDNSDEQLKQDIRRPLVGILLTLCQLKLHFQACDLYTDAARSCEQSP